MQLRLLLNSGFTGANAFFALGDAQGLFRAAGLDLHFSPGRGAWTAAARLAAGEFDLAYGDLNALVQLVAQADRQDLPRAIAAVHQHAPSVIAVPRNSLIRAPRDLAGKRVLGHASDVALQTFALFARAAGLAPGAVHIETSEGSMAELLQEMLAGRCDAVFGYATTHSAALAGAGLCVANTVRFLAYRDLCPALYGSALMVSASLLRQQPKALRRLVQVLRSSVAAAQAHAPDAIAAVLARAPGMSAAVEAQRWQATLMADIGLQAPPDRAWGRFDRGRLSRGMADLSRACGWPRVPLVSQVVDNRFVARVLPLAPHPEKSTSRTRSVLT